WRRRSRPEDGFLPSASQEEDVMTHEVVPPLVATARAMVADGRSWRDVAPELRAQANGDRDALAQATLHWVREMRHRPSGDLAASAVLRALEAALNRTPRRRPAL